MELKDLLTAIKYPVTDETKIEEITIEDVNTHMTKGYIGLEIAHEVPDVIDKVVGKERSSNEVVLKRVLKELDVKLPDDIKWKDGMIEKAAEALKGQIEKLKTDATKDNDKKLTELTTEYDKLKVDYATAQGNIENITKEKDEAIKNHQDFLTNQSLSTKVSEARNSIEFGDDVDVLKQKGFWATMQEKYSIELSKEKDSKDELRIITTEDKKRVNDGKENLTLKAIFEQEAKEAKILKVNNKPPEDKPRKPFTPPNGDDKKKVVFQGAIEHEQTLENQAK